MRRLVQRTAALLCAALMLLAVTPARAEESGPFTVLLIGVDTSGRAGRSDVMMLASVDPQRAASGWRRSCATCTYPSPSTDPTGSTPPISTAAKRCF